MGVGDQRHAQAALPSGKIQYQCIGGWVDLRADLDRCGKSRFYRDSIPGQSRPNESLYRLSSPSEIKRLLRKNILTMWYMSSMSHAEIQAR
jgi:hypothetical protein